MLDEADKLLDMDFEQEIDQILKVCVLCVWGGVGGARALGCVAHCGDARLQPQAGNAGRGGT